MLPAARRPALPAWPLRAAAAALLLLPLSLVGCEDLGPDRARIVVRYEERAPLTRDRLALVLRDGRREYYLEGLDLAASADGWLQARELRVANTGELDVLVMLRGSGQSPVAQGKVAVPLSPNVRWRLDVFASDATTAVACGDCTGFRRFTIEPAARPSARDWLYVTWTMATP